MSDKINNVMNPSSLDWNLFKRQFLNYLDSLAHFDFSVTNPLFWIIFCIVFLIFLRFWKLKKAFSCCVVIALVLVMATKAERSMINFFSKAGEAFDPVLVRIGAGIIVLITLLYYSVIRSDD